MNTKRPLQSFEDVSDSSVVAPHLKSLRAELAKRGLDGFIVPRADEHQGEYVPPASMRLAWATAFTGSAGCAVILKDCAALFVDGRYTLQARAQTNTALIEPRDLYSEGPAGWIASAPAARGAKIGYDAWLHTPNNVAALQRAADKAGATLVAVDGNPIDAVWEDRPEPPTAPAVPHPVNLSGEESKSKRTRLAQQLKDLGADATVLTLTDSVCWLLNIRGADVPCTPVTLSFAILHADTTVDLFIDARKTSHELIRFLGTDVRLEGLSKLPHMLEGLHGKTVVVDPATAAAAVFDTLGKAGAKILRRADMCQLPKAIKNPVELEGFRKAHKRDAVAMVKYMAWLDREAPRGSVDEISAAKQLEAFRQETGCLKDLSFDTISAAGEHAALPHYHVTVSSCRRLTSGDVYLVDSGAQYADGTTDITRTIIVGKPTDEMKDRFTRVLKSHIALATAKFPVGTYGIALDAIARKPLWDAGIDFDHGTGHGVGSYLSVHEGPQRIAHAFVDQTFEVGMVVSDEPGYYREGAFGIRTENLLIVQPVTEDTERPMYGFEVLTLCPIDTRLINVSLLTLDERLWLNTYHAHVRDEMVELVEGETRAWLISATHAI